MYMCAMRVRTSAHYAAVRAYAGGVAFDLIKKARKRPCTCRPTFDKYAAIQGLLWYRGPGRCNAEHPSGQCVDYTQGPQPEYPN